MDTFEYLSDTCLAVQKGQDPSEIWPEIIKISANMLEKGNTAAIRRAYNKLVCALGSRTQQIAHQSELCSEFIKYLAKQKKSPVHRVVAVYGLKAICDIQNDNVRGLKANAFITLVDCLKNTGSNLTYKLALLEALASAYTSNADHAMVRQVWKFARSLVFDPSLALANAALQLMTVIISPQIIKSQAKYDKLSSLCIKAFNQGLPAEKLLARATFMLEEASDITVLSNMHQKCADYPVSALPIANGIIDYIEECMRISTSWDYSVTISTITTIIQNPKMRDPHRLSIAFNHIHYILVDVLGRSLVEEKQRMALVQSLVTRLATTDRHHQLLSACLVPCLGSLFELVVLPPSLADIVYQATVALLEMSTCPELSLRLVDFVTRFLSAAPQYYGSMGSYCLDKLDNSSKVEHALLLGAVLTTSNKCDRMMELKPRIVEKAIALVKQKGQQFDLDHYKQGWILLQAFCTTPSQALRVFIPHYLGLFTHMLTIPEKTLAGNELRYQIEIWKPALDCVVAFGQTDLITPDISRKIGILLQDIWNYVESCPSQTFEQDPLIMEDIHLSRKMLACYSTMNFHGDTHNFPATLLTISFKYLFESFEVSSYLMDDSDVNYSRDFSHDPLSVMAGKPAVPPAVDMLDMSLEAIIAIFPVQLERVKESLLDSLRSHIESRIGSKKDIDNLAYLFAKLLERPVPEQRLERIVESVLKTLIKDKSKFAAITTGNYIYNQKHKAPDLAKFLLDQIIATVGDPVLRASYCEALKALISRGGLNSRNLHEIFELLTSLTRDPHPSVHMAAIDAMLACSASSGLLDRKEGAQLLDTLTALYISDSTSCENDTLEYSNLEMSKRNTWMRISQGLSDLVSLIGPNLKEDSSLFKMLYRLVDQLTGFSPLTTKYTWECYVEVFYYASDSINWLEVISQWRDCITNATQPLPEFYGAAIRGILLFTNHIASRLFDLTGPQFERELWLAYDVYPSAQIKQIFSTWVEQTITVEPEAWIARLQQVISKPRRFTDADEDFQNNVEVEEEDESLGPKAENANNDLFNPSTRKLALDLLISITQSQLHDKPVAVRQESLITRNISDIIKIAFNAATSTVLSLQVSGLTLLNLLIKYLNDLTDPDFPEVALLEQFQAQISSALTPAFNSDSSYELASAVIDVCANFVGSGIIKNAEKFNKILKTLSEPLKTDHFTVGKLKLEPLQTSALKIKISKFWAILESDKSEIALEKEDALCNLWIQSLTEFTSLEFKPNDHSYTSFFAEAVNKFTRWNQKHILLPVYRDSWVEIVSALAVMVERHGAQIITKDQDFMFGLVGLCFAELLKKGSKNTLNVLMALKQILQPGICASLVYDNDIFLEVVEVLDRIVLTGTTAEKACVIEIARNLANSQGESDDSVDHLFELFRTCVFPLKELFPFLINPSLGISPKAEQEMGLTKLALESLIDMVQVFREVIQNDQFFCLMFIFERIFSNPDCQEKIVPHIFSSYKRLIEVMTQSYSQNADSAPLIQKAICNAFVRSTEQLTETQNTVTVTNTMLTCMVLLCTAGNILEPASGNIVTIGQLLAKFVGDNVTVAVQSVRTILRASSGPVADAFVYGLVPGLMEQLLSDRELLPKDICNLLVEYAKQQSDPATSFTIVLPALMHVLNSQWDTPARRTMYIRALLFTVLEAHPQEFKQRMTEISAEDRNAIQGLLLEPAEPEVIEDTNSEIALTSFT